MPNLLALLSVLTLNLHGYHPMGEAPRWLEDRSGRIERAESKLFHFTREELDRGNRKRLDLLAKDVVALKPDVALLQEVAAGSPDDPSKTCETFLREPPGDAFEKNSAQRLRDRLKGYDLALACRGNLGWWTEPGSFAEKRVLRGKGARKDVVFDFGSNPYPNGILVEGLGVLVRAPWKVVENRSWRIPVPPQGKEAFFQTVLIGREGGARGLVVNLHAGWNFEHFEQAVAIREALKPYLDELSRDASFAGVVTGGDFNAGLFRWKKPGSRPWTVPWELAAEGDYDYRASSAWREDLKRELLEAGADATQVDGALGRYARLQTHAGVQVEALDRAVRSGVCSPVSAVPSSCQHPARIDLLFADSRFEVVNAFVTHPGNDWFSTEGVSDHPGLFAQWRVGR